MTSWREIERLRKDPSAMRGLATRLLKLLNADLTEWEIKFLKDISQDLTVEGFTTRQSEKSVQIRDDTEDISEIGYSQLSVKLLIADCQLGHLGLEDDDEEWILSFPKGTRLIKRRHGARLLRCARTLQNIDEEDAA